MFVILIIYYGMVVTNENMTCWRVPNTLTVHWLNIDIDVILSWPQSLIYRANGHYWRVTVTFYRYTRRNYILSNMFLKSTLNLQSAGLLIHNVVLVKNIYKKLPKKLYFKYHSVKFEWSYCYCMHLLPLLLVTRVTFCEHKAFKIKI